MATPSADHGKTEKEVGLPGYSDTTPVEPTRSHQEGAVISDNFFTRNGLNLESFKKRDYGKGIVELDRSMQPRHLNMIAIGGSIGAGFFVGSGSALNDGGPGSLLIAFLIIGVMLINVVYALGELAVMYPVSGGFYTYATRFIDPSWGFAMGWNYVMQWCVTLPLELTVAGLTVQYWNKDINVAAWISVFFVAIIVINIFGTLGYAEEEFWGSCLKLAATCIFIFIAFILVLGGGPSSGQYSEYWGARLWYDPGAFKNGFVGFCSVFVTAAFSYGGTELVGLAAAEAKNPVQSLPSAIKQVFWRITLFYILGLLFVGLLVSSDNPSLLGSTKISNGDPNASPFVIAAKQAGLKGFDDFMNVIILVSVMSIGCSAVYGGSRCLTALAQQGYAPKPFTYVDRSGRPLFSVMAILIFSPIAYITLASSGATVFNWLEAISGLATLFTWGSICLSHIRFRKAWAYHGHSVDEIPFQAIGGVWGSYLGLFLIFICLAAEFYTAIEPLDAYDFFEAYLALPIVLAFWLGGYLWKREGWLKIHQMDVDSGRRELDMEEIRAYKEKIAAMGPWKRALRTFI